MGLADLANQYIAEKTPWAAIKDPDRKEEVHQVCSLAINLYRILIIYLKPILPAIAIKSESFLNCEPMNWSDIDSPLTNNQLNPFKPMLSRIEDKTVEKLITSSKPPDNEEEKISLTSPAENDHIDIKDFSKIEMKVAKVITASEVEGADKLLQLTLDVGDATPRSIFSGIKSAYSPQELENRLVIVVTNLAPRKMKFGISEGMILAAGQGEQEIFLLSVDAGAYPGMVIS